ncbi:serine/threonine protein kinase [Nocardia sp. NBC_01503]|uniref:serine/threonine-protein kinase n=1 Tax=Nocardia sp. NBC_01503 TaxID=2975997 RepID=UPI002E7BB984|nr:serine/threonine-protein kinase [Nocardia sp. NBC_01503]WTL35361.1 serine/threonine protein kinase [Nocardia sp. NBC_01503]
MANGDRAGSRFGQYELRRLLGVGGMGEVYEAYDTVRDRTIALKLLDIELAKSSTYVERFRRESRTAARLQEPHVIPVHDWGEVDGVLYIDMRLVNGCDLREHLAGRGPLEPRQAVEVVEQVAAALDAAHQIGLVHRDVKPANILLTGELFAYLVDFGIAHIESDAQLTSMGSAIGSFGYMAPERFEHSTAVAPSADVYALACVLYESLTGRPPFQADNNLSTIRAHMMTAPPRPSSRPGIPVGFDEVVAVGMAKDPGRRYPSASQLARAARAALAPVRQAQPTRATVPATETTMVVRQSFPADRRSGPVRAGPTARRPVPTNRPHPSAPLKVPPPKRFSLPVVIGLFTGVVLVGAVLSWRLLSGNDNGDVIIGAVTPTATVAPLVGSVSGTDEQGFLDAPRCNTNVPALVIGRTAASRVLICYTSTDRVFYKGFRISDGAVKIIENPLPDGSGGYTATNLSDGTQYRITAQALTIVKDGNVLGDEQMIEYAHR